MTIQEKQDLFISEFNSLNDWFLQYEYLIEMAAQLEPMPEEEKIDSNLVHGCQSTVWLTLKDDHGVLRIHTESDSMIVNGILAVIVYLVDGESFEDVAAASFHFFERTPLKDEMTSARANGIRSILDRLKQEAANIIPPDIKVDELEK